MFIFLFFQEVIKKNLTNLEDIKLQLSLIKLIAFMVPLLCALRRKMRIPDISRLLPPLLGTTPCSERNVWCVEVWDEAGGIVNV